MKKDIRLKLKHLASKLPQRSYKVYQGNKLPIINDVNHLLRLKRAFKRSGIDGVINYFAPFAKEPKELAKTIKQYLS